MALAKPHARRDGPAVALGELLRDGPLTAAQAILLADAVLAASGRAWSSLALDEVLVTEAGCFRLVAEGGDPTGAGRLLCEAPGAGCRPRAELAPAERTAPALVP